MPRDIGVIADPEARNAYAVFLPQRQLIRDFYELLPDDRFDFRMVDTPTRRSDSPRESLIHIIETQLAYFGGMTDKKLAFGSVDAEPFRAMTRRQLLDELERIDQRVFDHIADPAFDPNAAVQAPWGVMRAVDLLFVMRDHDILHVGWNLALMDHLGMPRFDSLKQYWG
jgi:hypothetical protein